MSALEDLVMDLKGEIEQLKLKNEQTEKYVKMLKEKDDQSSDDVRPLQNCFKCLDLDQIDMKEELEFLQNWSFRFQEEKTSKARDEAIAKIKSVVTELGEIYGALEKMRQESTASKMEDSEKESDRNCCC
ncbi:hypothetical protein CAEBREN_06835 [Caenorhabditis brenneri]|uniref:Uncharacterized protein n=1 Tax=Caenorhabditis brenneri TaxID=135651 RepID=G0P7H1_CAEBE|nr:hypothetical protein CAEBREN_06835 [Caenorhabditis brenneri]